MKKILGLTAAACALAFMVGCASTPAAEKPAKEEAPVGPMNESTKTGMDAIPAEELAKAAGVDDATITFANATQGPWKLNGGKNYVQDDAGDCYINIQYEGEKWAQDITGSKASLIDVGDGDKALKVELGLNKTNDQYGFLMNISKQGATPKDISGSVLKMRIYVPEELVLPNKDGFVPTLRFAVRDPNWAQYFLSGEGIKKFTFADIGAGWHTITLDFANKTYDLGSKTGTFSAVSSALKKCNMIDLYIEGKKISSNLDVPFIIDWIDLK